MYTNIGPQVPPSVYTTSRNREVVLCLVQIDIHTYISVIYVYIYINYLFETIFSKAWPLSSVFL